MGNACITGGICLCPMGAAPMPMKATPKPIMAGGGPAMTIMDKNAMMNVGPFGVCKSMANPATAAATAAAMGALTPMPCTPVIPGPWMPGSPTVLSAGMPSLNNASKLICAYGGAISIIFPGELTVMVP